MWLPKDERKLLAFYARKNSVAGEELKISDEELIESLKLKGVNHLHDLKRSLHEKGLIICTNLGRESVFLNVQGLMYSKSQNIP
jgi:hypothetical protein